MIPLVLLRPHTHAGKPLDAGEKLQVSADIADWLIANGIARRDRQSDASASDPKPLPRKEPKP